MELWALCDPCDRWFFVPFERLSDLSSVACDDCGKSTTSFEARSEELTFALDVPPVPVDVVAADPLDVTQNRVIWLQ
jgi:hypothetical protein